MGRHIFGKRYAFEVLENRLPLRRRHRRPLALDLTAAEVPSIGASRQLDVRPGKHPGRIPIRARQSGLGRIGRTPHAGRPRGCHPRLDRGPHHGRCGIGRELDLGRVETPGRRILVRARVRQRTHSDARGGDRGHSCRRPFLHRTRGWQRAVHVAELLVGRHRQRCGPGLSIGTSSLRFTPSNRPAPRRPARRHPARSWPRLRRRLPWPGRRRTSRPPNWTLARAAGMELFVWTVDGPQIGVFAALGGRDHLERPGFGSTHTHPDTSPATSVRGGWLRIEDGHGLA